ncbi:MAG: hypothetical protein ABR915_25320 [Thermoguttaceae bacterium]
MKTRMMALPGIACLLAGILAAPLAAQTSNNSYLTSTSTTGIQPVNDLLPVLVTFTGPQNWDAVGSATGQSNGTNGSGSGQWWPVAPSAAQSPTASSRWGTGSFAAVAGNLPLRASGAAPDGVTMSARPVWPNFAPIASVQPVPNPPAAAVRLPPPIWKK